ncbi:MAG: hypothetical protein ACRDLB_13895 [Actinomycetota bacterium]
MLLGHALGGAGGPELEFLILAAACLFLGIFFFFQKNVKPQASVVLLVVAIGLAVGAFAVDTGGGSSPATISIVEPADGGTIAAGEELVLSVAIENGELTTDTSSSDPSQGHLHVYVDGQLVSMPSTEQPPIPGDRLRAGEHEITVEFTQADHEQFEPRILDEITVTAE